MLQLTSSTKNKIFIALGLFVFVVLLLVFLVARTSDERVDRPRSIDIESDLVEVPGVPQEDWDRSIEVKEVDENTKTATNHYDGYQLEIPFAWHVSDVVYGSGSLIVAYNEDGEYVDQEKPIHDLSLRVRVFENTENLQAREWLNLPKEERGYIDISNNTQETETRMGTAHKTPYKNMFKRDYVDTPREDSLTTKYVFVFDDKVYVASCEVVGENYLDLMLQCESIIKNNFIIFK